MFESLEEISSISTDGLASLLEEKKTKFKEIKSHYNGLYRVYGLEMREEDAKKLSELVLITFPLSFNPNFNLDFYKKNTFLDNNILNYMSDFKIPKKYGIRVFNDQYELRYNAKKKLLKKSIKNCILKYLKK